MSGPSIVFCLLAAALGRYQSIVDRMPFGEPPPNFNPAAMPGRPGEGAAAAEGEMTEEQRTEEEKKLAATIRVSVMNVTPKGDVMVGFTDSSAQPPENYYMRVGQERNGWKIESADPAEHSTCISKGGVTVTLKLGEGTAGGKGGAKNGGGGAARLTAGSRAPAAPAALGGAGGAMSLLRSRRAREQARAEEERKRREAAEEERRASEAEKAALEAEKAEIAKREAEEAAKERQAMQEQLRKIAESIKQQREESQKKDAAGESEESPE